MLQGRRIVLTRPQGQAQALANLLIAEGAQVQLQPLLTVAPVAYPQELVAARARTWDWGFFVSPNAVRYGVPWLWPRLPKRIAAVGAATATALARVGIDEVLVSPSFDSEGLLACPALQTLHGQHCLVVRGQSGRPLLGDHLRARGAAVTYARAYWRTAAAFSLTAELAFDAVVISSSEALGYWVSAVQATSHWSVPLFATHPRIFAHARAAGLPQVHACAAGDVGIVTALSAYFETQA